MAISICILSGIVIHAFYRVYYSVKHFSFGIFDFLLFWFAFIYGVVPIFIMSSREFILDHYIPLININNNYIIESVFVLVSYICIIIGGATLKNSKQQLRGKLIADITLFKWSLFLYVLSLIFLLVYIRLYGGLLYVLNNISMIRYGVDDNKNYLGAFFLMLTNVIIISFLALIYLRLKGFFKGKPVFYHIIFWLIIFSTFAKSLTSGGRANVVLILIYILLSIYFMKRKIYIVYILIISIVALLIVVYGKTYIFNLFGDQSLDFNQIKGMQEQRGYIKLFIYEFNHQFLSLSNYIQYNYELRYFKDYIIWAFKPLKFFDSNDTFYDSISYYNTYLINKKWQSEIPPGFIGLAYINGSILGVILQSFIWGRALKWIDLVMNNSNFKNNGLVFVVYLLLFNYLWFAFQNGDIALIIQGGLVYLFFIFILFFTKTITLKNI